MLPCEKSVGGIPTRRTLSLQPWRPRRRIARWIHGLPDAASTRLSFSFLLLLLLLLFLFVSSLLSRPRSMTGGRGVRKINDIFRGARAMIRAAWVPKDKDDPTSPIDRARTNERGNATFSHRMLACCEYVNIFYSTLSLGRGIKLFPPRGCRGRFNLLVATKSGNPFRSVQRIQSYGLGLLFREREIFSIISIVSDFSTK